MSLGKNKRQKNTMKKSPTPVSPSLAPTPIPTLAPGPPAPLSVSVSVVDIGDPGCGRSSLMLIVL